MSRRDVEDVYPLAPAQQGMLFHALMEPGSGVYLGQVLYRLTGDLDVDALRRALQRTADAYPVLRTAFVWEGLDEPLQVVRRQVEVPLARHDWRGLGDSELERRLRELTARDLRAGFDLTAAPLVRFALVAGDGEQHLLWTFHHLLLDGWSVPLVVRRILALYAAFAAGEPEPALPRPRPYRDFIARLRQRDAAAQETFWRRLLAGAEVPTPLGVDRAAGDEEPAEGRGDHRRRLPAEVAAALEETARRHRLTVSTLLQGAWALLLSRYARNDDVVFGVTTSGRPADLPGAEEMVGMFINTLPLRARVDPAARLFDWLAQLQEVGAEVREHDASPLVEVQRWAGTPAGRPLFDSILVFENFPSLHGGGRKDGEDGESSEDGESGQDEAASAAAGPAVEQRDFVAPTHYPLTLLARPRPLSLTVENDRRRVDDAAADRLAGHLASLLSAMAAAGDDARLGDLSHVGEEERRRLVFAGNDTARAFPLPAGVATPTLHAFVAARAAATPGAEAVRHGDDALSYGELVRRARRLAAALGRRGVAPGEVVGVCLERSLEMEVALLGILFAGAAYLPLEPELPAERLGWIAGDAGCRWVLTGHGDGAAIPAELTAGDRRTVAVEELLEEAAADGAGGALPAVPGEAVAYVIYTSGSTGRPKGVAVPHRAIVNRLLWMQDAYPLAAGDRVLQKTPFGFDVSVWELFWPLMVGAGLVFARPGGHRDPDYLLRTMEEAGITTVHFVPSMLAAFLDAPRVERCGAVLRRVFTSGEALSPALARRFFRRLGSGSGEHAGVELHNLYGPTEAAVDVSSWACDPAHLDAGVPIGRPIANVSLHVLDRRGDVAGAGVPGELVIGGVALAHGYLGRPALTAERFVPDPFPVPTAQPGGRLYRTGDLARVRGDGAVEFLGRLDHQVKVRGYRVELGEIEAVLAEHPAVREGAVLLRTATQDGAGEARLVAYAAPAAGRRLTAGDLADHLRQRLPEAMVPAHFVLLDALPQTASGKIDRLALPAPSLDRGALGTPYEAPRTPGEELLAGLWQQVLGVPRVGRRDDFFSLGGHSLLALRLLGRLRDALGVELDLAELFAAGDLAAMAQRVDAALRGDRAALPPPLVPVPRQGPLPLSYAQQRLWFLAQLDPGSAAYHIPLALVLRGPLRPPALKAAFSALVERHEALRSRFVLADGEPRQVADEARPMPLPLLDLAALPAPRRRGVEERLKAALARYPFDLARGPLLRALLLRRGGGEHVLLLTVHHVVADARSMEVMLGEVGASYAAAVAGRRAELPELPVQYADYAAWERNWLTPEVLADEVEWWRHTLDGAGEVLELPTDRPRPAVQSQRGAHAAFDLQADLVADLEALARRAGVTPFMVLLAGWLALLRRYTRQPWIQVGTTTAGRDRSEVESLVGFFVNTLVLRTKVDGDPDFEELLARVRETTLAAYAHRTVPFERLVHELHPQRDLATTPFFQTVLTFHQGTAAAPRLSELAVESLPTGTRTAKFDLELEVSWRRTGSGSAGAAGARANFEYATDLFDATTIDRFGRHLRHLLRGAAADPATPLSALPLLPAAERAQVLREWNDSAVATVPREHTFAELFARRVARTPDRVAATWGELAVTYGELDRRAERLARRLVARGFGPERVVALFTLRDLDALAAILAVFKAGGAYVPLDPLHPTRRLSGVLAASGARLALVSSALAPEMEDVVAPLQAARRPEVLELGAMLAPGEEADAAPATPLPAGLSAGDPRHLAYVIFTSGSTGTPKGAMLEQRGMVNHLFTKVLDLGLGAGDVVAQTSNISFDVHVWQFLVALLVGGRTDVFDDEQSLDARRLLARLEEQAVSVVETVPSQLRVLLEEAERLGDDRPALRPLRWMIPNGEVLPPELCERWLDAYPHGAMINAYGPTECSDDVLHHAMHAAPAQDEAVPIGRPLPNLRLYVLDETFEPVPTGVPGDLYVAGAGVGRGYLNDPRRTAVTFLPNPLAGSAAAGPDGGPPGDRLYRTGDRARWRRDGRLDFLGRVDFQVKVRGFRIELGEIEAALRSHPAVEQAVVLARRDAAPGGAQPGGAQPGGRDLYLCAYLVLSRQVAAAEVQEHVADRVPPYMVPPRYVFLDAMPLTANGKLDRKALPAPSAPADEATPYEAPRGELEETVARVWRDVLGAERVGRDDDFFALGGHSLSATRVTIRLADELGLEVPVRTLFLQPTVAQLAASLEQARQAAAGGAEDTERRIRELRERIARMKAEQEAAATDAVAAGRETEEVEA